MAALEPYGDFIRELFDNGKTHDEISTALKQSGAPKCSVMTVRRFCVEHNLQRRNLVSFFFYVAYCTRCRLFVI